MRVKGMHPLCCITLETSPATAGDDGDGSPEPTLLRTGSAVNFLGGIGSDAANAAAESGIGVAGILYKWTNYGKGWRSRWFTLRNNGVLSYSKTRRAEAPQGSSDVVLIGSVIARRCGRKQGKSLGIVHLKVGKSVEMQ